MQGQKNADKQMEHTESRYARMERTHGTFMSEQLELELEKEEKQTKKQRGRERERTTPTCYLVVKTRNLTTRLSLQWRVITLKKILPAENVSLRAKSITSGTR